MSRWGARVRRARRLTGGKLLVERDDLGVDDQELRTSDGQRRKGLSVTGCTAYEG